MSISRKNNVQVVSPLAPPMPPAPVTNSPSLGSTLVHSVTSGLGSGVGFGLGSSLVRSFFGSTPSASPPNNDYIQCLEANKFTDRESNCYHLSDSYKACMIRTNFNRGECSRD
jgi:hypothetical protein